MVCFKGITKVVIMRLKLLNTFLCIDGRTFTLLQNLKVHVTHDYTFFVLTKIISSGNLPKSFLCCTVSYLTDTSVESTTNICQSDGQIMSKELGYLQFRKAVLYSAGYKEMLFLKNQWTCLVGFKRNMNGKCFLRWEWYGLTVHTNPTSTTFSPFGIFNFKISIP